MGRTAGWLSLVAVFHSWKFATGFVLPPPPGTRTQGLDNRKNHLSTTTTTLLKASVVPSSSSPSSHQDGKDDTLHPPSWWTLSWFRTLEALGATEVPSAWHHATEAIACRLGSSGTEKAAADIVQDLANVQIPRRDGGTVLAYQTGDNGNNNGSNNRLVLLIHEFYGLSSSICQKADALAQELGCTVIAPDTFRGEYSTFIPYCLWLALATPQDRVNQDLDDVVTWWLEQQQQQSSSSSSSSLSAVMGFCYGGGKAIRYTTECQPQAATVICYGSPTLDVKALERLQKPVCGVFGALDPQFPPPILQAFERALEQAASNNNNSGNDNDEKNANEITVYPDVGHAFWADMDQVAERQEPQFSAYQQVTKFLAANLE